MSIALCIVHYELCIIRHGFTAAKKCSVSVGAGIFEIWQAGKVCVGSAMHPSICAGTPPQHTPMASKHAARARVAEWQTIWALCKLAAVGIRTDIFFQGPRLSAEQKHLHPTQRSHACQAAWLRRKCYRVCTATRSQLAGTLSSCSPGAAIVRRGRRAELCDAAAPPRLASCSRMLRCSAAHRGHTRSAPACQGKQARHAQPI